MSEKGEGPKTKKGSFKNRTLNLDREKIISI